MEKGINNTGAVKNEWIGRIESYVKVNNARTLKSLNGEYVPGKGKYWELLTDKNEEDREDFKLADGWVLSIVNVRNLTINGNPDIERGLRVYIHDASGNKLEETLYLADDDDGVIGRSDVCYELRSYDEVVDAAINNAELFVRDWLDYFKIDVGGIDYNRLKSHIKYVLKSGKYSYDAVYSHSVEWLMWQIKVLREAEARVRELYDDDGFVIVDNL